MGWEVQKLVKSVQSSSTVKTRSPEQSIVGHETQWTQPWSRVRSQVDVIHLVRLTGAIVSNSHLHSVKSCPEKSRPIKYGGQMHGLMIAIEYSYKLDRKNYFNLWCELGQLLLRQLHISNVSIIITFLSKQRLNLLVDYKHSATINNTCLPQRFLGVGIEIIYVLHSGFFL